MAGFLPLIVFALLAGVSQDLALWAAFAAAFAVSLRDFAHDQVLRLLDCGAVVIFGATALFAGFVRPGLSVEMTRLTVDVAFLVLALLSLVFRAPLTCPSLREMARAPLPAKRRSRLVHYALSGMWAAGFAAMAAADAFANIRKDLPSGLDGAVALSVLLVTLAITARAMAPESKASGHAGRTLSTPFAFSRIPARSHAPRR